MNAQYLLVVVLAVVSVAQHTQSKEHDSRLKRSKRQTSADQMVQNILQWLQGVYTQNSRRIRQGTLREYLPPANTQRPRPFQPGYPPAGAVTPQPPFPVYTNAATGAVTAEGYPSAPAGFEPPGAGAYPGGGAPPTATSEPGGSTPAAGATPTTYLPPGPRDQPSETPAFPTHPADRPAGFPTGYPSGLPTIPPSTLFPDKPGFPTGFPAFPTGFPSDKPGFPTQPPTGYPSGKPGFPTEPPTGYPSGKPGFPTQPPPGGPGFPTQPPTGYPYPSDRPGFPTQPPTGYPSGKPGFPTEPPTGYPSGKPGFPTQPPTGYPSGGPGFSTQPPAVSPSQATTQPPTEAPTQAPTAAPTQPPTAAPTQPPTAAPEQPPTGYPSERPAFPTQPPTAPETPGPSEGTPQPPQDTTGYPPAGPPSPTTPPPEVSPSEAPTGAPEQTAPPPQPGSSVTDHPELGTSQPAGFSTQPPQPETPAAPEEPPSAPPSAPPGGSTTDDAFTSAPQPPDSNTIPDGKSGETPEAPEEPAPTGPSEPSEGDDLRHPPHIHAIDVQCAKDMMTINIEFNRQFDGVIYSKGYYSMPECRYVKENSAQTKYSFTVSLNSCGTEFINAFDTQGQSYLENILVLQNEPGIQEVWDTVRSVRCLWEGSLKESLSVALSVGMLNQEIVTFSGDTAMAKLDINLGRGPFGQPANGLVKIGEPMTLVVSVSGDSGFDIQVKDCRATDSSAENNVQLTDDNGCVLKPKLFGAFQKTRNTGDTGASIIAFAYFNAFKFPDVMDLMIECNIELCKTDCEMCPDPNPKLEPARRRRRRDLRGANSTLADGGVTMGKHLMVVLPEDLNNQSIESIIHPIQKEGVCMSTQNFLFSVGLLISLLVTSCTFSVYLWLQRNRKPYLL